MWVHVQILVAVVLVVLAGRVQPDVVAVDAATGAQAPTGVDAETTRAESPRDPSDSASASSSSSSSASLDDDASASITIERGSRRERASRVVRPLPPTADKRWSQSPDLVMVVTRHGDRTPVNPLPGEERFAPYWYRQLKPKVDSRAHRALITEYGDELVDVSDGSLLGQLTLRGAQQMTAIGRQLRKLYVDELQLLPPVFHKSEGEGGSGAATVGEGGANAEADQPVGGGGQVERGLKQSSSPIVEVHSPRRLRPAESAQHLLLGLYPPEHRQPMTLEGMFVDIPIRFNSAAANALLPGRHQEESTARTALMKELQQSRAYGLRVTPFLQHVGAKVAGALGLEASEISFPAVHEALHCRMAHSLPLPMPPKLIREVSKTNSRITAFFHEESDEYARLTIQPLLKTMCRKMRARVAEAAPGEQGAGPRFVLHSAHDTTLNNLLHGLGMRGPPWPHYASLMEILLWRRPSMPVNSDGSDGETVGVATVTEAVTVNFNSNRLSLPCDDDTGLCSLDRFEALYCEGWRQGARDGVAGWKDGSPTGEEEAAADEETKEE